MDRENEPMSETAVLPLVDVIKKEWKRDNVITFLQRKDLNLELDGDDIEIIRSKKIGGEAFLSLKKEGLASFLNTSKKSQFQRTLLIVIIESKHLKVFNNPSVFYIRCFSKLN